MTVTASKGVRTAICKTSSLYMTSKLPGFWLSKSLYFRDKYSHAGRFQTTLRVHVAINSPWCCSATTRRDPTSWLRHGSSVPLVEARRWAKMRESGSFGLHQEFLPTVFAGCPRSFQTTFERDSVSLENDRPTPALRVAPHRCRRQAPPRRSGSSGRSGRAQPRVDPSSKRHGTGATLFCEEMMHRTIEKMFDLSAKNATYFIVFEKTYSCKRTVTGLNPNTRSRSTSTHIEDEGVACRNYQMTREVRVLPPRLGATDRN